MKTTMDLSDGIMRQAKAVARREKMPLRDLVQEGLLLALKTHALPRSHKVKPVIFSGRGLNPEFQGRSWAEVRDEIYRERGS